MNLRRIDLNLLVAFDALMRTRHVTRAASLIGIGQPGMSAALARLRLAFQDELLVKQGGEMVPTARARELEPEIRRILRDVDLLVSGHPHFEAETSKRTFTIRMSDLLSFLLLPRIIERLSKDAPAAKLEVAHLGPEATIDALERNAVELAVSTNLETSKSIESESLFEDRVVVVARSKHPALKKMRTLEGFLSVRQIKVAQSPIDDRFADRQLGKLGQNRSIAVTVPHWLAVPHIVAQSDLVAIMPLSIARAFQSGSNLALLDAPFLDTTFAWSIYWHRRQSADPGLIWLRNVLRETSGAIQQCETPL